MVRCGTVGPFDSRPNRLAPKAGDLGFRHPAAGSLSPPVCRVVGVNRTLGGGHRAHRRSDVLLGKLPGAAGLSRARKPPAVPVAVVVGQPGVEVALCRRTGGHCAQADKRPNPRTYEGIFRPRVCTLNCNRLKGQFCPGRLAPSCRRSVRGGRAHPPGMSRDVGGDGLMSDHQAGRPGTRLLFEVLPGGPCGRPDQSLKAPKATKP